MALYQRAGGIVTPLITAVVAFFVGGLVVLATTGKNPITTYRAIFDGTGLNWLFPWASGDERTVAALNLQQTLIQTTPLILTGLAVAFAFRCGMFNIGGQGQYIVGAVVAAYVGIRPHRYLLPGADRPRHRGRRTGRGRLGRHRRPPEGDRRRARGDHDDHAQLDRLLDRQLARRLRRAAPDSGRGVVPSTEDIADSAKLHVFWGDPLLQGLHIGFFIAIGALVAFWVILKRTTLGFGVRAVGFNPEAARYGGISVARNYFLAMAISGAFAGLAAAWTFSAGRSRLDLTFVQTATVGFIGIAVALLGRNTAVGIFLGAMLFGALLNGTSTRNLDPSIFQPSSRRTSR